MENYIVRIYRRNGENPSDIVGIIEEVGVKEKKVFKDFDELCLALTFPCQDWNGKEDEVPG